ncbi:HNH endonuclease [Glutamicibacter sp. NPDC127525]|uniref:HNH endonuclease n=1 Tax=unclassified Glutamicibacter TaxID=2627139 RepID=UPI0036361CC8
MALKAPERFAVRLQGGGHDGQCWEWVGIKDEDGYGKFSDQRKKFRAHRWAWMHLVDSNLERETELDHICMNVSCVRPSHLQSVKRSEHVGISTKQQALLKTNEDSILVGGNRKARSVKELFYAVQHGLPSTLHGARTHQPN